MEKLKADIEHIDKGEGGPGCANEYRSGCIRPRAGPCGAGHPHESTSLLARGTSVVSAKGACDTVAEELCALPVLLCSLWTCGV